MKGILTHSIISRGEDRPQWKGDRVSYRCLHRWVEVYKGRPRECECCHTHEGNRFHWANISGTYKRNLNDWIRLCPKCHKGYDLGRITLSV